MGVGYKRNPPVKDGSKVFGLRNNKDRGSINWTYFFVGMSSVLDLLSLSCLLEIQVDMSRNLLILGDRILEFRGELWAEAVKLEIIKNKKCKNWVLRRFYIEQVYLSSGEGLRKKLLQQRENSYFQLPAKLWETGIKEMGLTYLNDCLYDFNSPVHIAY